MTDSAETLDDASVKISTSEPAPRETGIVRRRPSLLRAARSMSLRALDLVVALARTTPPPPLETLLRRRAGRSLWAARLLLLIMVSALVSGGVLFLYAGDLLEQEQWGPVRQATYAAEYARVKLTESTKTASAATKTLASEKTHFLAEVRPLVDDAEFGRLAAALDKEPIQESQLFIVSPFVNTYAKDFLDKRVAVRATEEQRSRDAKALEAAEQALGVARDRAKQVPLAVLQGVVFRASIVLLLIFLVQMLTSLQRYYVQVGAHYNAVADALSHVASTGMPFAVTDFGAMVAIFKPVVGFGRPPRTLPQEATDLVAAALKR